LDDAGLKQGIDNTKKELLNTADNIRSSLNDNLQRTLEEMQIAASRTEMAKAWVIGGTMVCAACFLGILSLFYFT